jgi:hypothetical protein
MKPCFKPPKHLEEAAAAAELRKRRAIEVLAEKLAPSAFERAMRELIEADEKALREKGR